METLTGLAFIVVCLISAYYLPNILWLLKLVWYGFLYVAIATYFLVSIPFRWFNRKVEIYAYGWMK